MQSNVVCTEHVLQMQFGQQALLLHVLAKQTWLTFLRSLASSEGLAARAAAVGGPASRPFLASLAFALLCLGDSGTSRGTDACSTEQVLGLCYTVNDMGECVWSMVPFVPCIVSRTPFDGLQPKQALHEGRRESNRCKLQLKIFIACWH